MALGALAIPAQAATMVVGTEIGVDFGQVAPTNNMNGAAVTSGADGSIAVGSLTDTSSVMVDGVGFSWVTAGAFNNSDADGTKAGQPAVFNDSNLTDWLGVAHALSGGLITLTFTGLDDSLSYDLLIGAAFTDDIASATWTADGQSDTTVSNVGADAFVTLAGLETDGSGNLVITSAGAGARPDLSAVAALTLTAVPEPSTAVLLGLGGIALILRRRR